jgi:MFS family permease
MTSKSEAAARASGLTDRPYVALNVCFALSVGGWMPILTLLAVLMRDHLDAGLGGAVITVLIIQVIATVVSLYAGTFAARWGSRKSYLLGTVGMAVFAVLLGVADEGWQVIAVAPLAGLVMPFHWTGTTAYILQAVEPRRRGFATGINALIMVAAPGLTGPLLTYLGAEFGLSASMQGGSAIVVAAALAIWLLLPELPAPKFFGQTPSFADYPRLLANRANLITAAARLTMGLSFGMFQLLSALVIVDLTDDLATVGFYLSAGAIGGGVSQVLVGAASDRFGRRNLLFLAKLIGIGACLVFWQAPSLLLLLVGATMHWFAQSAYQTLITAICGDLVAPRDLPTLSGLHTSSFSVGMVIGAIAGGLLWGLDTGLPFLFVVFCLAPVAAVLFLLPQRTLAS